jgi:hypothetical protein
MTPPDHRCIVCEEPFTRDLRPAGEIEYAKDWGDACPTCYHYYQDQQDTEDSGERASHILLTAFGAAGILIATLLYFLSR